MNRPTTRLRSSAVVPLLLLLLLSALVATAQVRNALPVPDLPGYKTLKCDFHLHTVFSDGLVWPTIRVQEAWRDGLDAISITDHSDYNPHKDDVKWDNNRPYALARELAEQLGIILIQGVEIGEGDIHANILFATDTNAVRGLKLVEALRVARKQNAFTFWNHPGWRRPSEWFPLIAQAHDEKLLDGMELVNGGTAYLDAYPFIEQKNLTILSNSDFHAPAPASRRAITLVFAPTADAAGVREALVARRTAAWMGDEVWGAEQHLRSLWEGAVKVENPELRWRTGMRGPVVRMSNSSAIVFKLEVRQAPAWLRATRADVQAQSGAALALTIGKEAPAGSHRIDLELEITNLHTGPGQNLSVRLPLRLQVN